MILTNCAACAAPLAHDAPRCVRCKVRYCDSTCQHDHWRRGQEIIPEVKRVLGNDHEVTLKMQEVYAQVLFRNVSLSLEDLTEAVGIIEDVDRRMTRILGPDHPDRHRVLEDLSEARARLAFARARS